MKFETISKMKNSNFQNLFWIFYHWITVCFEFRYSDFEFILLHIDATVDIQDLPSDIA
jgi:hypothetical protein